MKYSDDAGDQKGNSNSDGNGKTHRAPAWETNSMQFGRQKLT